MDTLSLSPVLPHDARIVFFDGVCGLCNSFVDFLLKRDKQKKLLFAPLQGKTAQSLAVSSSDAELKTVVFYQGGTAYDRSDAVIEIFSTLGGVWKLALIGRLLPLRVRNALYDWISRNRFRWFGKRESCRLPGADEKGRILA